MKMKWLPKLDHIRWESFCLCLPLYPPFPPSRSLPCLLLESSDQPVNTSHMYRLCWYSIAKTLAKSWVNIHYKLLDMWIFEKAFEITPAPATIWLHLRKIPWARSNMLSPVTFMMMRNTNEPSLLFSATIWQAIYYRAIDNRHSY